MRLRIGRSLRPLDPLRLSQRCQPLLAALDGDSARAALQAHRLAAIAVQQQMHVAALGCFAVVGLARSLGGRVCATGAWDWEAHSAPLGLFVRGHRLMMQPAFAVVFWCGPERQQSGLAVLEEGHLAMRR